MKQRWIVPKGLLFTFNGKNARFPRSSYKKHAGEYLCTWRNLFQLDFCPNYCIFVQTLQYSGRMTIKGLPKELLKIKGREPLPQIYPNHVTNMATKAHADSSFKSKYKGVHKLSFVPEFKSTVSFSLVVLRVFFAIIIGLVGGIFDAFSNIEAVLFMVIDSPYEDHLCFWQFCVSRESLFEFVAWIILWILFSYLVLADISKLNILSSSKTPVLFM